LISVVVRGAKHSCARNNLILGDYCWPSSLGASIIDVSGL
jgi:hypothetical protein